MSSISRCSRAWISRRLGRNPRRLAPKAQASFAALEAQPSLLIAADPPRPHDKLGQLRISRLREHFSRVSTVEDIAATRRFMHWDLVFADILLLRGGFDLIAGNPPWIRVEWNESGVLSERNPVFAIRKVSASDLVKLRAEAFRTSAVCGKSGQRNSRRLMARRIF
jgi:hypothetical protein